MNSEQRLEFKGSFLLIQILTMIRIPLSISIACILVLSAKFTFAVVFFCLCLVGLMELSDLLDGYIARRFGHVTEWGAMFDPYSDSVSRLITYWAFAVSGLAIPLVPLAMAIRDITVAYCRITLSRVGKTVSAKKSGKIKAIVQGVGAALILLGPLYWPYTGKWTVQVLSWIIILVTIASIAEYAASAISADRKHRKNSSN